MPRASARAAVRILGIDPGTLRLGYGVVECAAGGAALGYVECGVISAPPRDARAERLGEIGRGLRELIAEVRPDVKDLHFSEGGPKVWFVVGRRAG